MVLPLEKAGPQHCFPVSDGFRCCNYTIRKRKDGSHIALSSNKPGKNMRFFAGNWSVNTTPPNVEHLDAVINIINRGTKKALTVQSKSANSLA